MARGQLRRRALIVLALAVAACDQAIGEAGPWTPLEGLPGAELVPPPTPTADATLRVVSWNVEYGGDVEGLAAAILGDPALARARVILVQEIESHPGEGSSRAARLAAALGWGYAYAPARPEGDGTHGLAILSSLPLVDVVFRRLPDADLPGPSYDRIALAGDLVTSAGPVRVVNVHLDTRLSVSDRLVQLRPAVIDAPTPVVAGGDLNTMPYLWAGGAVPLAPVDQVADTDQAPIVDAFMRRLGFATPTAGLGPTQSSLLLGELRLDSLYPRGLAVGEAAVERTIEVSDHWPIWVEVSR